VLAEAGLLIPDENDEEAAGAVREDEVEKFKEFLDSVSPDDFRLYPGALSRICLVALDTRRGFPPTVNWAAILDRDEQ
jgi:hypothetical protein